MGTRITRQQAREVVEDVTRGENNVIDCYVSAEGSTPDRLENHLETNPTFQETDKGKCNSVCSI